MEIQDRRNETWSQIEPRFETKRKTECLLVLKDERWDRGKFVVLSVKERRFDDIETRGVFWDADLALAFCKDVLSNRGIDGKSPH
jgi:hypothetical protein